MREADDFYAETEQLYGLVIQHKGDFTARATRFKGWTPRDVITHLAFWNHAALLSLTDAEAFKSLMARALPAFQADGGMRPFENDWAANLDRDLMDEWTVTAKVLRDAYKAADPQARVQWAGPSMSVRSSATARLMETWAHGQAVYDAASVTRPASDRLKGICVLGINTFAWSFQVRGEQPPGPCPRVALDAPSGGTWVWNAENESDSISGPADAFCQVVTQVRHVDDTALRVSGPVANAWMARAQCFAGPPETPPAPGTRKPG